MLLLTLKYSIWPREKLKQEGRVKIDIVVHIYLQVKSNVENVEVGMVQKYGTQIVNIAESSGSATINSTTMKSVEHVIKEIFIKATNKHLEDKDEIIANFEILKTTAFNTGYLEKKKVELQNELKIVAYLIQDVTNENAHTALDQDEYQRRYNRPVERFDTTKSNLEATTDQIKDKITRHQNLEIFLQELNHQEGLLKEFDPLLWNSLVDYLTVFEEEKIQVTFKNGIET